MMSQVRQLNHVFTDKQLHHVLKQSTGDEDCELIAHSIRPAAEGLTGFLGDHLRVSLHAKTKSGVRKVQLFVKSIPLANEEKARVIDSGNFFRREMLMFTLFEDMGGDDGPNPWRPKALIYTETLLVMPDMAVEGYASYPETLDLPHALVVATSIARFHAAYANYATRKSSNARPYCILDEHRRLLEDPTFCDSLWLHAAAKLSANLLETFSAKYQNSVDLEEKLFKLYLEACNSFTDYKDTLNVLIHRDLWANNIMFRYECGVPVNSLLIDYQCLRYGPPAFDLTMFLYLTTSRSFREAHEAEIFAHYFSVFSKFLDDATRLRLNEFNYNLDEFLGWCERSRMFGLFMAIGIFPYVLMDAVSAQKCFDDPETFMEYNTVDRSAPVLAHCGRNQRYKDRQMEVTEEFMERYASKML